MTLTVSTPVKLFALLAALAALLFAGAMTMMGREDDVDDAAATLAPRESGVLDAPARAKTAAAAQANADAKTTAAAPASRQPAAPAGPAQAKTTPKSAPAKPAQAKQPAAKPRAVIAANGLPAAIAEALRQHDVVVVALWTKGAKTDVLARDEAAAGAAAANAGFVALDVITSEAAARALTLKLDVVLRTPTVLVFRQPDLLALRLDGFYDRETVAQAAVASVR